MQLSCRIRAESPAAGRDPGVTCRTGRGPSRVRILAARGGTIGNYCRAQRRGKMSDEYPYNGRLSRWDEIAPGLAIIGVQALEDPFPFTPGQYATLGLMGSEKLIQRPMSISSSAD